MNKYPIYNLSLEKYKIIAGSALFLILSYVFMYLGSKNNYEFLALTLSPIMQIIAYIAVIYAVIKNSLSLNFFRHTTLSDEELLISISDGDNDSFNVLYSRYKDRLLYYFYRMLSQDKELSKDFLQEIFIKVINKPHLFDPKMKFSTWIFSIANNMCKNEYRKRDVRKNTINYENPDILNSEDHLNTNHEAIITVIFNQLDKFDDSHKSAFLLKYREGFSVDEISQILELPAGTIKSRLFYTRKKLQENIKDQHPEIIDEYNLY